MAKNVKKNKQSKSKKSEKTKAEKDSKHKGKQDEKGKVKKAKKGELKPATKLNKNKDEAVQPVQLGGNGASPETACYSDGHPQDCIQYIEAKLILKPDRFVSAESLRDFGKLVQRAAKEVKVGFIAAPESGLRPEIREIIFGDTSDFRLYNSAFILRRRTCYVDGFPAGDPEIVFKFRHPDEQTAAALDVRPNIAGDYRIKFKAEVLPLKDAIGGYRLLYSHNCQFGLSQMHEGNALSMGTLARVFPALAALKKDDDEKISLVNEGIVEEVLLPLGQLDFGKGIAAKCDVSLWRTRGEHMPLVGEFAFQAKFNRADAVHQKSRKLLEQFYITLQRNVQDWISLGTTKTGMVYRMKGNAPQSHE